MKAQRANPGTLLRIYLNDHLAALGAEVELARRCGANNRGTDLDYDLSRLVGELQEDQRHVRQLLERSGMRESRPKQVLAVLAERIGRLKLNGQLRGYSDLSRLVELEALCLAAEHRLHLWRSLETRAEHPRLRELPFDELVEKASRQRQRLEEHRLDAARRAFGT
ncbi:MAG: hypothetical protein ABR592_11855 [Nitriliruptorales bacterium]